MAAAAGAFDGLCHLLQRVEDRHASVVQFARHFLAVDTEFRQCLTRCVRHQSDILDTHDDGIHVLVGKDTALGVLYDGNELTCADTSVTEGGCVLLDHTQQLTTVSFYHSLHTVT